MVLTEAKNSNTDIIRRSRKTVVQTSSWQIFSQQALKVKHAKTQQAAFHLIPPIRDTMANYVTNALEILKEELQTVKIPSNTELKRK